jgi:hypothetical protein
MPTLADIYSAIDSAKRRASDFVQNPGTSLEQMVNYANDRAGEYNRQMRLASEGTRARLKGQQVTPEQQAADQYVTQAMTEAYSPVGMTAVKGFPTDYHAFGPLINEAYVALKKTPSLETSNAYKALVEARENAPINNPNKIAANYVEPIDEGYKGQHAAPMKDSGQPLHNLSGIYPDDFYSFEAANLYGHGMDKARDARVIRQLQVFKDRPSATVTIYRAVPKDLPRGSKINQGDWVTTDRQYAIEHGLGALNGNYKIISKTAKARDLFTNGDSIYELGYDPQPPTPRLKR